MKKGTINEGIHRSISSTAPALKRLALQIHSKPELGYKEREACRRQVALLKSWKFKVTSPFASLPTAFKAVSGSSKPTLCFISEYDALPELGHGCGHNLIAASALGAGRALADALRREKISGSVVVMGTPAEEAYGGKVKMIRAGALKGLDAAIMAHPSWRTEPDTGSTAVNRWVVNFYGKAAHAAASPELGRSALDAVMLLFQGVNAWRQELPESSRVHGIITHGGAAPNVTPDFTSCFFYLRATDDKVQKSMNARFSDLAKGAALMTGTRCELKEPTLPYKARRPNRFLNEAYLEYAELVGLRPVIPTRPCRGSSDFGDVSQAIAGAHVYFSISREKIPTHSKQMVAASASPYGLDQMVRTAEALANIGYRFFTDKGFRSDVLSSFKAQRAGQR